MISKRCHIDYPFLRFISLAINGGNLAHDDRIAAACTVAPPVAVRIAVVGSIICPSPLSSSQSEEGKRARGNDDGRERYFDDLRNDR